MTRKSNTKTKQNRVNRGGAASTRGLREDRDVSARSGRENTGGNSRSFRNDDNGDQSLRRSSQPQTSDYTNSDYHRGFYHGYHASRGNAAADSGTFGGQQYRDPEFGSTGTDRDLNDDVRDRGQTGNARDYNDDRREFSGTAREAQARGGYRGDGRTQADRADSRSNRADFDRQGSQSGDGNLGRSDRDFPENETRFRGRSSDSDRAVQDDESTRFATADQGFSRSSAKNGGQTASRSSGSRKSAGRR